MDCLNTVTDGFFVRQVLVIFFLTLSGLICNECLVGTIKNRRAWCALLAFPLGLALYSVCGFIFLLPGVPFNAATLLLPLILIALLRVPAGGMRSAEGAATTAASNETVADTPDEKGHDIRAWFLVVCTVNLCALIDILNNGSYLG